MTAQSTATLRTTQILIFALIMGVVLFTITVVAITPRAASAPAQPPPPGSMPVNPGLTNTLLLPAGVLAAVALVVPLLVSPKIVGAARAAWERSSKDDDARATLPGHFQILCIVRGALAEGLGLFCTVAAMLTGELLFLAGSALSILLMLAMFPTSGRWREFFRQATGEDLPSLP